MQNNWLKILVFCILSSVLGFILGRTTVSSGVENIVMEKEIEILEKGDDLVSGPIVKGETESSDMDAEIQSIIEELRATGFQGDSAFTIGQAEVHLRLEENEVEVEMRIMD